MRRHHLTGVAAIAFGLSVTAAAGQNIDERRDTDQGKQTDQVERNQQPQTSGSQQGAGNEQLDRSGLIALDQQDQVRIGDFIRQQRIRPVTKLNFPLNVAGTVPSSVRLSRISGELAELFPNYRDFSFFVAKQDLVIVDPQSYAMVAFVPFSDGNTVGAAPPRENTATAGTAPPRENTSGTAETPVPAKKKATRTERKRVTVTEDKPKVIERDTTQQDATQDDTTQRDTTQRDTAHRDTVHRRSPRTETDVTVGASRRDSDDFDEAAPRNRDIDPPVRPRLAPPVRERNQGMPFPFSLFFFGWPK